VARDQKPVGTRWSPRRPVRAKTLAAFLAAIDALVREGIEHGLTDETHVLYVSAVESASNDIQRNLEAPVAGVRAELERLACRCRDPHAGAYRRYAAERTREHAPSPAPHRRHDPGIAVHPADQPVRPPHARDDPHGDRRRDPRAGAEQARSAPALSLERLEALTGREPIRIGLSATQKPIEEIARFLSATEPMRAACRPARSWIRVTSARATSRSSSRLPHSKR